MDSAFIRQALAGPDIDRAAGLDYLRRRKRGLKALESADEPAATADCPLAIEVLEGVPGATPLRGS